MTSPSRRPTMRRVMLTVSTLLAVLLLGWLVDLASAFERLRQVDTTLFLIGCMVAISCRVLRAMKWNFLLRSGGISISHLEAFRVSTIGLFFGAWTPAQLGNDAYRTIALRDTSVRPDDSGSATAAIVVSSLIVERYANWLSIALIAMCGLPWTIPWLWQQSFFVAIAFGSVIVAIISVGILCIWIISRVGQGSPAPLEKNQSTSITKTLRRVRQTFAKCIDALNRFRTARRVLILFHFLTLVEIFGHIVINGLVIRSFAEYVSIGYLLLAMPAVYLLVRLPVTIQGIGVQEGAFGLVLVNAGLPIELGLAVSLVQRVIEWLTSILPGAAALCLTRPHLRRAAHSPTIDV